MLISLKMAPFAPSVDFFSAYGSGANFKTHELSFAE